jgi:hypothetical protein
VQRLPGKEFRSRQRKLNQLPPKSSQKPTLGLNVRIIIPDIDRAKADPRSITAQTLKMKNSYELATELGKLKALYTRNQFNLCKENYFKH